MKTFYASDRKAWRKWLEKNHDKKTEIWLVYYKKITGLPTVKYEEAVEEALCFGWIDSMEKGIDSEKFAGRFSPRRSKSHWSESNIKRAKHLILVGLMTEAGRKVLPEDLHQFP